MSLRERHAGHHVIADEGSSGFLIAYCVTCKVIVGTWDGITSGAAILWDDEPEYGPPEPPGEHPLLRLAKKRGELC